VNLVLNICISFFIFQK